MNSAPLSLRLSRALSRALYLLILTSAAKAQAYPQVSAFVDSWGIWGVAGARATVTQFPQQVGMTLPIGTNASSGFDLTAALSGSTARSRFALQSEPLRAEARTEGSNTAGFGFTAESPVRLVLTSAQSMNLVLRVTGTFRGVVGVNPGNFAVWLSNGPFAGPLAFITPTSPASQLVPITLTAGTPLTLYFGSICGFTSANLGSGETIGMLELASASAIYDANFAPGCAGSAGQPTLATAGGNPVLGTTFDLMATGIPSGAVAVGLLGFQNVPIDLGSLGAPGCRVATDIAALTTFPHAAGSGTWSLAIPNQASLLSLVFLQQCVILDPPANALGLSLTNCGRGVFGQ